MLGKSSHVVKREHRIEIAENGPRFGGQCGFAAAAHPQVDLALNRWNIPVREIDSRLWGLAERVVD